MDLVLEVLDTVVFDRFYATLWPLNDGGVFSSTNGTSYSSITESPALINNFHFKPSTQYFQVPPSKWAYLTTWERYNPWRQMLSLYLITLYANPSPPLVPVLTDSESSVVSYISSSAPSHTTLSLTDRP